MDDDFNVVRIMDPLADYSKPSMNWRLLKAKKKPAAAAAITELMIVLRRVDEVLNLFSEPVDAYLVRHREKAANRRGIEPSWIEGRISERIAARTGRDWALADQIRDELLNGIVLMDHPEVQIG